MNPCHCAPMIELDDGKAIWESCAVMRYFCNIAGEKSESLYPSDPFKRAQIDLALDWRQTSYYPCLPAIGYIVFGMGGDLTSSENAKAKFEELQEKHFKVLMDTFLKDTKFIYSDTPTIADLAVAPTLTFIMARPKYWEAVPQKIKDYRLAVLEHFSHTKEEFDMLEHMATTCEHERAGDGL
jgi:glutathione S-transferase